MQHLLCRPVGDARQSAKITADKPASSGSNANSGTASKVLVADAGVVSQPSIAAPSPASPEVNVPCYTCNSATTNSGTASKVLVADAGVVSQPSIAAPSPASQKDIGSHHLSGDVVDYSTKDLGLGILVEAATLNPGPSATTNVTRGRFSPEMLESVKEYLEGMSEVLSHSSIFKETKQAVQTLETNCQELSGIFCQARRYDAYVVIRIPNVFNLTLPYARNINIQDLGVDTSVWVLDKETPRFYHARIRTIDKKDGTNRYKVRYNDMHEDTVPRERITVRAGLKAGGVYDIFHTWA